MHETSRGNGGRAGSRKSVVLAHSSDLHIDDEVVKGPDNGLVGLGLVFDAARRAAADVILLAGDTFDNLRVSQTILTAAVDLLASAPVPVVLLPGNHDPSLDDCLYRRSGLCDMTSIHVVGISQAYDAVVVMRIREGPAFVTLADGGTVIRDGIGYSYGKQRPGAVVARQWPGGTTRPNVRGV